MKSVLFKAIALACLIACVAPTFAQRGMRMGGGRGGGLQTLTRKDVQEDLKLTPDQIKQIEAIQAEQQQAMQSAMENMRASGGGDPQQMQDEMQKMQATYKKKADAVLTADQQKRLKEINVQLQGTHAIMDKDVQKELGLTEDQIKQIQAIQAAQRAYMQSMRDKIQSGEMQREDIMAYRTKQNEKMDADLAKILTQPQKDKLKEMGGKPFVKKDKPGG